MQILSAALAKTGSFRGLISKALEIYLREGWYGVKRRFRLLSKPDTAYLTAEDVLPDEYAAWIAKFDKISKSTRKKLQRNQKHFTHQPCISVLMPIISSTTLLFKHTIQCLLDQIYPHWELYIAIDTQKSSSSTLAIQYAKQDPRIKLFFIDNESSENNTITVLNNLHSLAAGEYITVLNNNILLPQHALYCIAAEINQHPAANLIYSDEDQLNDKNKRFCPNFKPDFNYELFLTHNMISDLCVYRKTLVNDVGIFKEKLDNGVYLNLSDSVYDLNCRIIERINWQSIIHIPRILCHKYSNMPLLDQETKLGNKNSTPSKKDVACQIVAEHLQRKHISATVIPSPHLPDHQRVRFTLPKSLPLVTIIIPTKDKTHLLEKCIDSIKTRSTYPHYEILIINNGSQEPETFALFSKIKCDFAKSNHSVQIIHDNSDFNYSALNNRAAKIASGSVLCLLNNDIEIITPDWLEELLSFTLHDDVGCVGPRLLYPNGNLQHAGMIMGLYGISGHVYARFSGKHKGYRGRALLHQNFSAITGACLMVRKEIFNAVGGLDENLSIAYNDVDFCLRVQQLGLRNVFTPYAEIVHHESATRGKNDTREKIYRNTYEIETMKKKWSEYFIVDPSYNPNLTLNSPAMGLAWPSRQPVL